MHSDSEQKSTRTLRNFVQLRYAISYNCATCNFVYNCSVRYAISYNCTVRYAISYDCAGHNALRYAISYNSLRNFVQLHCALRNFVQLHCALRNFVQLHCALRNFVRLRWTQCSARELPGHRRHRIAAACIVRAVLESMNMIRCVFVCVCVCVCVHECVCGMYM